MGRTGSDISGQGTSLREALLWELAGDAVRCLTCERRCVLAEGQAGWCGTRQSREGKLYTLIYGLVSSLSANPIEQKPLYHFYPGTVALTVGSWSCNLACPWCQNWQISKRPSGPSESYTPQRFVSRAVRQHCAGTSISLNEPALSLEWSLEVFRLARKRGLYNTHVTNGYMTSEALRLLAEAGLDALNVDIKGDADAVRRHCGGVDVEKVWRNCCLARELGLHLEVTTLVIPGVNDGEESLRAIAKRIADELGPETPWHITGYYPAYRFTAPATPVATLERAWQIGQEAGLAFVYIGNVPGNLHGNTYCPECGALLVERFGLEVIRNEVRAGQCPSCGKCILGIWEAGPGKWMCSVPANSR